MANLCMEEIEVRYAFIKTSDVGSILNDNITSTENSIVRPDVVESTRSPQKKHTFRTFVSRRIKTPLIPLKIALFFFYGAVHSSFSFSIIYMKRRGFSPSHFSILFGITPIFQFLIQIIIGIISDKTGKNKILLYFTLTAYVVFTNALLLQPINDRATLSVHLNKNTTSTRNSSRSLNCTDDFLINKNDTIETCLLFSEHVRSKCNDSSIEDYLTNGTLCKEILNSVVASNATLKAQSAMTNSELVVLFFIAIARNVFSSSSFRLFDVATIYTTKIFNSDFGKQRIWSLLGSMTLQGFTGYMVQISSSESSGINFSVVAYIISTFIFITIIAFWTLDVQTRQPGRNMCKNVLSMLKNIDFVAFLIVVHVCGIAWYFFFIYSPYFLDELEAPSLLIGLKGTFESFYALPVLFATERILKSIGARNVFVLALLFHAIQSISYSFLSNPWWALLCAINNPVTYHLPWVAAVTHAHEIAPEGITSSVIFVAGIMHYTLGMGVGGYLGGYLMKTFGSRWTFRIMATIAVVTAFLYAVFLFIHRRNRNKRAYMKGRVETVQMQNTTTTENF